MDRTRSLHRPISSKPPPTSQTSVRTLFWESLYIIIVSPKPIWAHISRARSILYIKGFPTHYWARLLGASFMILSENAVCLGPLTAQSAYWCLYCIRYCIRYCVRYCVQQYPRTVDPNVRTVSRTVFVLVALTGLVHFFHFFFICLNFV